MDAADVLYGVSMGGDGVTKVISRRLPKGVTALEGTSLEAA
jgi:chromosome segregation protein